MHDHAPHDPGADLALWATAGDHHALERVLAIAATLAYQQAFRLLGRACDAEDASQEALVQLIRSARRYDVGRPFRPWLAHLVHVACCRLLRSGHRRRRHENAATQAPRAEQDIDAEAIRAAVLDLPEVMRQAIELHYFAGLSQAEAAASLKISENACSVRLHRARERLRHLLMRRGVHLTASTALALLIAVPASAAPAGLATTLAAQAAAGALPTSTIPLTSTQQGIQLMSAHPHLTVALALGLGATIASPFLASGAETVPQPVIPAVTPPAAGAGDTRGLLAYLDPDAHFQMGIDLAAIRPDLLRAKPYTLASDPRLNAALQQARARWQAVITDPQMPSDLRCGVWLFPAPRDVNGLVYYRNVKALAPRENHWFLAADVPQWGDEADKLLGSMGDEKSRTMSARMNQHLVIGSGVFLSDFSSTPPSPAWFSLDLGPVQVREVAGILDWRGADPAVKAPRPAPPAGDALLSDQWRYASPRLEGKGQVTADAMGTSIRISGLAPISPLVAVGLVGMLDRLPAMAWALRRPTMSIPESADRLASVSLGLTPPAVVQPFPVAPGSAPFTRVLAELMPQVSGDLAIEVRPGIPVPKVAVVVGLRTGADPADVLRRIAEQVRWQPSPDQATSLAGQVAVAIDAKTGAMTIGQDGPGSSPVVRGTISGETLDLLAPAGVGRGSIPVSFTAYPDRLVITVNATPEEWPGIASAVAPADAAGCTIAADLPAMAHHAWPLLGLEFPWADRLRGMAQAFNGSLEQVAVGPVTWPLQRPLTAFSEHLPQWSVRWEPTVDGGRIEERGIPLMSSVLAAASVRLVSELDRIYGTASGDGESPAPPPAAVSDF